MKISCLILVKEIIAVYSENHMEPVDTLNGQNTASLYVKVGGIYAFH
jgi:hypothetical protein